MSACDLQVRSRFSSKPPEWVLRRLGIPASYTSPEDVYHKAKAAGMDFVTITDFNTLEGVRRLVERDDVIAGVEVTAQFEDGARIGVLVWGLDEGQHARLQELRSDIRALRDFLVSEGLAHGVTSPLGVRDERFNVSHVEKILVLFNHIQLIHGQGNPLAERTLRAILPHLTKERIEQLAAKHNLEPYGAEPWRKTLFGGSDDRGGLYLARAYTETPPARDRESFLAHLREGRCQPLGQPGSTQTFASSMYAVAYRYLRALLGQRSPLYSRLLERMFDRFIAGKNPADFPLGEQLELAVEALWSGQIFSLLNPATSLEKKLAEFITAPELRRRVEQAIASETLAERRTFAVACEITNHLGFRFFEQAVQLGHRGDFFGSLQSASALVPLIALVAPYLQAFSTLHSRRSLLVETSRALLGEVPEFLRNTKRAWLTDTLEDVNGVARTIRTMTRELRRQGRDITVITSRSPFDPAGLPIINFEPVGEFELPEYQVQKLSFPPVLRMLDHIQNEGYSELIISTPGPVGIVGLAAARLFGLRVSAIYHTDFPQYVRILMDDEQIESLTWQYMQWFYSSADVIYCNSKFYADIWKLRGISQERLKILPRGLDAEIFSAARRKADFWVSRGARHPVVIYVGRISKEKDLDLLPQITAELKRRGIAHTLALVGDGPYRMELQQLLPGAVFTGVLTGDELGTAYASADVFLFPSTTDTYGNVVVEAAACGLPVVVSDVGGPRELVKMGIPGEVCRARDAAAFAQGIERAMSRGWQPPPGGIEALSGWSKAAELFWQSSPE